MPVDSPAFASLQDLTPSLEHRQGPWHENTPVLLLHSPGAEKPSWHELEAQSFPSSSVFQSSASGVLGAPATMIYPGHGEDSWLTEVNSFLGFISKRH